MDHGGKRAGAGRKPGQKNKLTYDRRKTLQELAQEYTADALNVLAEIMLSKDCSDTARANAANSLLDRGHGKPKQPVEYDLDLTRLTDEQALALALALGADPAAFQGDGRDPEAPLTH
jgi:endonuclease III